MLNSKIFPFERNRYYFGKLLTSADFVSEQCYFNDKRRLLNRMIFDYGIVTGLNTFRIDELTVSVESGLAIDRNGREILIPQLIAKKLSSIKNFEQIRGESFYLCLSYEERASQTGVNVPESQSGSADERNRFEEGYGLMLKSPDEVINDKKEASGFIQCDTLYDGDSIKVTQSFPKLGQIQSGILFKTVIENTGGETLETELSYRISVPGIISEGGNSYIEVKIDKIKLAPGKRFEEHHTGRILVEGERNVTVGVARETFKLIKDGAVLNPAWDKKEALIALTERSVFGEVCREVQSVPITKYFIPVEEDYIVLARVKIKKMGLEYRIEEVEKNPFGQLAYSVAAGKVFEQIREYYPPMGIPEKKIPSEGREISEPALSVDFSKYLASGVIDIPIGLDASAGSVFYSDEIMHGLGRGAVSVTVAVETYRDGGMSVNPINETIWGKTDIFEDKKKRNTPDVETAVKVMGDRGTFIVGIRLLSWTDAISISLRWSAFKAPDLEKRFLPFDTKGGSMVLSPDTIVLMPGETTVFTAVFSGMEPAPCTFELMDASGGTVDNNGQYVAPSKEGVFEIRAISVANPNIIASAFALVKQKKVKK